MNMRVDIIKRHYFKQASCKQIVSYVYEIKSNSYMQSLPK